jgi:hypothetical protein
MLNDGNHAEMLGHYLRVQGCPPQVHCLMKARLPVMAFPNLLLWTISHKQQLWDV